MTEEREAWRIKTYVFQIKRPDSMAQINVEPDRIAQEGWELVSVSTHINQGTTSGYIYTFKQKIIK